MTPLERKAAYVSASILKEHTLEQAAAAIGAHPNHIYLVLAGKRDGSRDLEERLARYAGVPVEEFLPNASGAASTQRRLELSPALV